MRRHYGLLFIALLAGLLAAASASAQFSLPGGGESGAHVKAELISPVETVRAGMEWVVGIKLEHDEHWHTYWKYPGTGLATSVAWELPEGFTAGPLEWPAPIQFEFGGVSGYGYEGQVVLIARIRTPDDLPAGRDVTLAGKVEWLECAELCVPQAASVSLTVRSAAAAEASAQAELIEQSLARIPRAFPEGGEVALSFERRAKPAKADEPFELRATLTGAGLDLARAKGFIFFPDPGEKLTLDEKPPVASVGADRVSFVVKGAALEMPADDAGELTLLGVIQYPEQGRAELRRYAVSVNLLAADVAAPVPPLTLWAFLAMMVSALIGGLILNVMPCVLPVISIKVFSFVKQAQESRKRIFMLGLAYCLGVLVSLWILAVVIIVLKAVGGGADWGILFQFPGFVVGLTAVVFVLGLNLLGVYEIQAPSGKAVQGLSRLETKEGPVGAFFTGVLATVLATPCSAPILGTALTFALAQPALIIIMIFTSIGVGLALPFLLLSAFPAWTRFIPKPGNWMLVFKQVIGFMLLATTVWLCWIVGHQIGVKGLVYLLLFLLALGVGCWMIGAFISYGASGKRKASIWGMALLLAAGAYVYGLHPVLNPPPPDPDAIEWLDYDAEALQAHRTEGRLVFLDFTAEWCLTCKSNEYYIIDSGVVREALREHQVVTMKADYTRRDPVIKKMLNGFGRSGVPLYVVYPPGDGEPLVLPEVISKRLVLEALERAAGGKRP